MIIRQRLLGLALGYEDLNDHEQLRADTGATGKADKGKVMKRFQELAVGRADGKLLSAAVMKRLA